MNQKPKTYAVESHIYKKKLVFLDGKKGVDFKLQKATTNTTTSVLRLFCMMQNDFKNIIITGETMTDAARTWLAGVFVVPRGGFDGLANTSPAPTLVGSAGDVERFSSPFPFLPLPGTGTGVCSTGLRRFMI